MILTLFGRGGLDGVVRVDACLAGCPVLVARQGLFWRNRENE